MKHILDKVIRSQKNIIFIFVLLTLLGLYYFFFLNRGLVLSDEGYYAHYAQRILEGQIPYKDFDLQYPPAFFYLIALFYKIFGISILTGRFIGLLFCLGIFTTTLYILRLFNVTSVKSKIVTFAIFVSFGYPLINIPVVVWPTVFVTGWLMIAFLRWIQTNNYKYAIYIGLLLAVQGFLKQNIFLFEVVTINLLFLAEWWKNKRKITIILLWVNSTWIISTLFLVYFFFIRYDFRLLLDFISFNRRYLAIWPFSYPPLTYLLQPLGFLKLLPYYLPIIFAILLIVKVFQRQFKSELLVLFLPLVGFFTTIYPTSDLLHLYPYFGLVLVAFLIYLSTVSLRIQRVGYLLILLAVISGLYLTLFREYYRYEAPYRFQNTKLHIARAKGILIDANSARDLDAINSFISSNTRKDDYIFVYSFSPMMYFLLNRQNPSRYAIYYPGYLTTAQEYKTIQDIQKKHVKYIITDGFDTYSTPLSKWISQQKRIKNYDQFTLYTTVR